MGLPFTRGAGYHVYLGIIWGPGLTRASRRTYGTRAAHRRSILHTSHKAPLRSISSLQH